MVINIPYQISGLTTNYIPVAGSATSLVDSYLRQSGNNILIQSGKYLQSDNFAAGWLFSDPSEGSVGYGNNYFYGNSTGSRIKYNNVQVFYADSVGAGIQSTTDSATIIAGSGAYTAQAGFIHINHLSAGGGINFDADIYRFQKGTASKMLRLDASKNLVPSSYDESDFALKANNLSDLASAATARTNLGLGDSATKNVGTSAGTVAEGNDARLSQGRGASYYRKTGVTTYEIWYTSADNASTPATAVRGQNTLQATPFIVEKNITIDRIAMEITAGGSAGSVVRIGIYDDVNLVPTNLVLDAGTIAGDSATVQSIIINQTLSPGLYWLAYIHNSAASPTFRALPIAAFGQILGIPATIGAGNLNTTVSVAQAYGAMPNPFTAGSSLLSNVAPIIAVRLSA